MKILSEETGTLFDTKDVLDFWYHNIDYCIYAHVVRNNIEDNIRLISNVSKREAYEILNEIAEFEVNGYNFYRFIKEKR